MSWSFKGDIYIGVLVLGLISRQMVFEVFNSREQTEKERRTKFEDTVTL